MATQRTGAIRENALTPEQRAEIAHRAPPSTGAAVRGKWEHSR